MTQINLAINGAAGRMGKRLIALGSADPDLKIVAAIEYERHREIGRDAGVVAGIDEIGVQLQPHLPEGTQVVIDFSVPDACEWITELCTRQKIPLVVATTGLNPHQKELVSNAAEVVPVVWSPSMSMTVNLAMKLCSIAGGTLKNAPSGCDVEIIERHHRYKEDSPSGTALKFGEIVSGVMGHSHHRHGREGQIGQRPQSEIGYHAVRVGDNPGEHTIVFGLLGETLEITVKASNRDCYAQGALQAAKFVVKQQPGLYSMYDVLGL
jgi:4-hydroxy-tetrahydrodipicolinate reductase